MYSNVASKEILVILNYCSEYGYGDDDDNDSDN